jgi:hypothetical protein
MPFYFMPIRPLELNLSSIIIIHTLSTRSNLCTRLSFQLGKIDRVVFTQRIQHQTKRVTVIGIRELQVRDCAIVNIRDKGSAELPIGAWIKDGVVVERVPKVGFDVAERGGKGCGVVCCSAVEIAGGGIDVFDKRVYSEDG